MLDTLLKLGAVIIALLLAAVFLAQRFGITIGIRVAGNLFADELGPLTLWSWSLIVLGLLEIVTLALLIRSHRSA